MFTPERREEVRQRLLDLAREDEHVVAAAIIGSYVAGTEDEWSDVDLTLGIRGEVADALDRWTRRLYDEFEAIHHWDLPWGSTTYRVFLLPELLQVDVSLTPESDFGPRGPNWRTVFGETIDVQPAPPPSVGTVAGLAWTMGLHALRSIARGKPWQAEHMISGVRDHVLELACLRLGYPTRYARGADELPAELTEPLTDALVRSLDESELRRALATVTTALAAELERSDPELAARLRPTLAAVAGG
jgi:predicted nucleotidyltransferase